MFPEPEVPKPTFEDDVQAKVVPEVALVKAMAGALALPQKAASVIAAADGVGLTVTVKLVAGPVQVPVVGVTDKELTKGFAPVLVAVYALIFPEPVTPKPTFIEPVQLKVVPATGPENAMAAPGLVLQ